MFYRFLKINLHKVSNRVYEVQNRRGALSLAMIRKLHSNLGIPAEVFIAA